MKRLIALVLLGLMICSSAFAEKERYTLEPGIYKVGTDIPSGHYDVRFKGNDYVTILHFSDRLTKEGTLDLTSYYSYSFTFATNEWWQAVYPIILLLDGGYLQIEFSSCTLYPFD